MKAYKAYTNIQQSKKLAEILPLDSADMKYPYFGDGQYGSSAVFGEPIEYSGGKDIPCWSLAALIELMPKQLGRYTITFYWCDDSWCCSYIDDGSEIKGTSSANNPVDATVEMIIKLKEKDLL